jgi:hypothetical protein
MSVSISEYSTPLKTISTVLSPNPAGHKILVVIFKADRSIKGPRFGVFSLHLQMKRPDPRGATPCFGKSQGLTTDTVSPMLLLYENFIYKSLTARMTQAVTQR